MARTLLGIAKSPDLGIVDNLVLQYTVQSITPLEVRSELRYYSHLHGIQGRAYSLATGCGQVPIVFFYKLS